MIHTIYGKTPRIASSAYVASSAEVIGDVYLGEHSSVWPGAVVRGDEGPIRIGSKSHIQDNSVVHANSGGLKIGDQVNIGHGVVIHCSRIGNHVLVGNNATVLDDVEIGDYCIIGAAALVPPRTKVPDYSFAIGVPVAIQTPIGEKRIASLEIAGEHYAAKAKAYKQAGL